MVRFTKVDQGDVDVGLAEPRRLESRLCAVPAAGAAPVGVEPA